jgi:D-glycero-D-manno-heptose 1,7-bisphosphate phosphatase
MDEALMNHKYICLDRDGVINEDSDAYVKNAEEWIPIPGSLEAIARLTQAGVRIAVVSNQAGLIKGKFTEQNLDDMTQKMLTLVESAGGKIEQVFYCLHDPDAGCDCRKPAPGLLQKAAQHFGVEAKQLIMVGDRATDVEAALMCGAKPILLKSGKGHRELNNNPLLADRVHQEGGEIYEDLADFVNHILPKRKPLSFLTKSFYALRAFLFYLFAFVTLCLGVPFIFLLSPFSFKYRFGIIAAWSALMRHALRWICGIRVNMEWPKGFSKQKMKGPYVICARHESALETLVLSGIFPMNCFVVKKALLHIPVFGWAFSVSKHIPIDRSKAIRSMMEVIKIGKSRIQEGISIAVFPEGTRMSPGVFRPFHKGAASIAKSMGVEVIPVTHNAGTCWKRNQFIKTPGTVTIVIGEPMKIEGLSVDQINEKVYDWVAKHYPKGS